MLSSHTPTTQSAGTQEGRANPLQHQLSLGDRGGGTAKSSSVPCTSAGPSRKPPSVLSPPAMEKHLSAWIQGWHTGADTLPGPHVPCLHQASMFLPPPQHHQSRGHPSSMNFGPKGLDTKDEGQAAFLSLPRPEAALRWPETGRTEPALLQTLSFLQLAAVCNRGDTYDSSLSSRVWGARKRSTFGSLETGDVLLFAAAGNQLCQKRAPVVTSLRTRRSPW